MKMQLDEPFVTPIDRNSNKNATLYENFLKSFRKLTEDELRRVLTVSIGQIKDFLLRQVPCIGCRTRFFLFFLFSFVLFLFSLKSLDNLLKILVEHRHLAFEPFLINDEGSITLNSTYLSDPLAIFKLFYIDG